MKQRYTVTGMSCAACSAHVEKSVAAVDGVQQVQVNLLSGTMAVTYDDDKVQDDTIIRAVTDAGYGASVRGAETASRPAQDVAGEETRAMRRRLIGSICFLLPLLYVSMGHMIGLPLPPQLYGMRNPMGFALTELFLTIPICILNRKYYTNGFKTLLHRAPNMDSLIAVGSGAAMLYGIVALYRIGWALGGGDLMGAHRYLADLYFESAGMILTLVTVGKYLETRAKSKTGEALAELMKLAPRTAVVERDGKEVTVPAESVVVGDVLCVRPGQSVAVDGEILEGRSALDESALTGESMPVEKGPGDAVYAATINRSGFLRCRASRVGEDTTLSQIIRLVEEAGASKAPIARLADRISGIFVPVVLGIALVTAVVWLLVGQSFSFALSAGIAVLVISCPCALGLATPVAIMVGTGVGAKMGVLFKSAEALEHLHTAQAVVLDKTGTVTEGAPQVTDVIPADGVHPETLLRTALALEQPSEHPLGRAVVQYAQEQDVQAPAVRQFAAQVGSGVIGEVDGASCLAGNARMLSEHDVALGAWEQRAETLAGEGKTPLFFVREGRILGMLAIADTVKPSSAPAVRALHEMGREVVMLTGDHAKTAEAVQRQIGADRVVAEVLPQDKERIVRQLQDEGKHVVMVGDGINDAPALARADVGVAIGTGTDVAIASADVLLMRSDLMDAVNAIRLSRQTIRNIRQNLFWAFFYNCIGIPLAAGVFYPMFGLRLSPAIGAAAMSLSSVCVVSNALRLRLFRPAASGPVAAPPIMKGENEMKEKKTLEIEGMMCTHCSGRVQQALTELDGVEKAEVSHEKGKAVVTLEKGAAVANEALVEAVRGVGYTVTKVG